MEQRLIGLCGPTPQPPCSPGSGTLNLTSPPKGNIAPPGYYMLFLLDSAGVPSKAQFIQLSPYSRRRRAGAIASPVVRHDDRRRRIGHLQHHDQRRASIPGSSPEAPRQLDEQSPGNVTFATPGESTWSH